MEPAERSGAEPLSAPAEATEPDQTPSRRFAALSYFLVALSGLILLVWRRDDPLIRFHAIQSILATVVFSLLGLLLRILALFPIFGFLYAYLFRVYLVAVFVLWVWVMFRAYRGERYKIPYVGEVVERQLS